MIYLLIFASSFPATDLCIPSCFLSPLHIFILFSLVVSFYSFMKTWLKCHLSLTLFLMVHHATSVHALLVEAVFFFHSFNITCNEHNILTISCLHSCIHCKTTSFKEAKVWFIHYLWKQALSQCFLSSKH